MPKLNSFLFYILIYIIEFLIRVGMYTWAEAGDVGPKGKIVIEMMELVTVVNITHENVR